jgi:sulfite dehydrogenase (quinone) subunit SoeC
MHPALSIIVFTVSSGLGYGLLALTGILTAMHQLPDDHWFGTAAATVALTGVTLGLISSTLHLGHPERAWRALSQWRSSWLSREGVAALAAFVPGGLLWLMFLLDARGETLRALLCLASAAFALGTVACTAMIYASLKPIRQWHNPLVLPGYLALALMTGALWLAALASLWPGDARLVVAIALAATALAAAVKLGYWVAIDRDRGRSSIESATGLGKGGTVRLFEAPHTSENYLLKEMGFRIARKHARRLRRLALSGGFALPVLLLAAALAWSAAAPLAAILAAVLGTAGALLERWLFFAEATHTVTLYYGGPG